MGYYYYGPVFFKSGYPVGVFFKGCEIFSEKFKGSENNPENFKGSENNPENFKGVRGAKFPVPEGIRGMTFSSARENKV